KRRVLSLPCLRLTVPRIAPHVARSDVRKVYQAMTRLTLPYPPSANRYWRNLRNGLVLVSREAKEYKQTVGCLCIAADCDLIYDDVRISIDVFRPSKRGDLDNLAKVLLDSLQGHAFTSDRQIAELHMRRFDDKANPRAEVVIEPMATARIKN